MESICRLVSCRGPCVYFLRPISLCIVFCEQTRTIINTQTTGFVYERYGNGIVTPPHARTWRQKKHHLPPPTKHSCSLLGATVDSVQSIFGVASLYKKSIKYSTSLKPIECIFYSRKKHLKIFHIVIDINPSLFEDSKLIT